MTTPISVLAPKLARIELDRPGRDTVLFWAGKGAMFQGLAQAMQNHLSSIEIVLMDHLPRGEFADAHVRLVLLQLDRDDRVLDNITACREEFPGVTIGLLLDDTTRDLSRYEDLLDQEIVQGLLPLELKLEVFLAATSLLIIGGEYYPPSMSRRLRSRVARDLEAPRPVPVPNAYLSRLTDRERQVLALLSEGFQNKLIADRMALSEHTVKVHVHNLISKLRVTNRTQAAAAFRSNDYAPESNRERVTVMAPGLSAK